MDNSAVLVSIIMPAYNAAATIRRAVQSALRQTEPSLQLIIIDDASTDDTGAIAQEMAACDSRVQVVHQPINRGAAAARNRGLECARGAWIALLDADDEFMPERLRLLLTAAEACGADIVSDNLLLCPQASQCACVPMLSPQVLSAPRWMSAAEFVAGNIGSRYTPRVSYGFLKPAIRRCFLEQHRIRYEEQNRFGEDFLLALWCLVQGARWWLMPQVMYRYTVRAGSATEVQAAADLLRICTWEDVLLRGHPMVRSDPDLAAALRRHKGVIEHFYYYRAFTDALKARSASAAAQLLVQSSSGFRHILTESAMQAPRVAAKALRGGYWTGRSALP